MNVGDTNYFEARFVQQFSGNAANVSTSLHHHPGVRRRHLESFDGLTNDNQQSSSGRFAPSPRTSKVDRLAGDYGIDRMSRVHRIRVHDPRHCLFVGIHVGRGHIFFRSDEVQQL